MTILSAEKVSVSYGKKQIIKDASFSIHGGTLTGLLGLNGCGKSTLIRALCGFIPYSGNVFVNEKNVAELKERDKAKLVSFIPQESALKDGLDLMDIVLLGCNPRLSLFSSPSSEDRVKAEDILYRLCLEKKADYDYSELSGGEKQMALIARSIMQDSPVMLMDEPDSSLDFNNRHSMLSLLRNMIHDKGYAGLIAIHSPDFALTYCDRLLIMKDGRIVSDIIPAMCNIKTIQNALSEIYDGINVSENDGRYLVTRYEK